MQNNTSSLRHIMANGLSNTLASTNFNWLAEPYVGKVRECYNHKDLLFLITTDRLSCFDRIITTIPYKGQILNQIAFKSLKECEDIVLTHLIDLPDPNVMVVKPAISLPVEVIVRGYLAGGGWRSYQKTGQISGVKLPSNMSQFSKLSSPIITPTTKTSIGHDQPISSADIVSKGLVEASIWSQIQEVALALYERGAAKAEQNGLILVDTKYEFGLIKIKSKLELILIDEIHTLDSSRYWLVDDYQESLASGRAPKMLDKEPARRWLTEQGFNGEGELPNISDEWRIELGLHYLESANLILGSNESFIIEGDPQGRIEKVLRSYL